MSQRVVLHSCCAPCSGAILEWLLANDFAPVIFYSNSNIFPREEYEKRRDECRRYADAIGVEMVEDDYDHARWLSGVSGLEDEPERGARCQRCFKMRLERAARFAAARGIPLLTTSLASSRWKRLDQIALAGSDATAAIPEVEFWDKNWRKGGLQERRTSIIREQAFYNQLYCGCEFSMPKS